ncbi:MAG: carboxypeptidase-like regulatory domain-containing protein [Pseudomonadota bacterium]
MTRTFHAALAIVLLSLTSLACDELLPANPYDWRAPVNEQARGGVRAVLFLDVPVSSTIVHDELRALTVRLLDSAGQQLLAVTCGNEPTAAARMACEDSLRTASVAFNELPAGVYRVVVDGLNPAYIPVAIPPVTLLPGEIQDLGTLRYAPLSVEVTDPQWTGRVQVEVQLAAGQGGARRVLLYRQGPFGLEAQATALTDAANSVTFDRVPPGRYALAAELEGFTPDHRVGFDIQGAATPTEQNTQDFTGSAGLTLYPVSAVLIPALQQIFGQYYTSQAAVPVHVLQFGGMNQMRLSTDANFASGTTTWMDYVASTDVDLPAVEGAIQISAQFRNTQVHGFTFQSPVYHTQVVRDVTPPQVAGTRVRGRSAGEDGKIWFNQDASVLSIEVDGQDTVSAVYSYVLHHDAQNSAGDPLALSFTLTESPGGLVRLDEEIGLTAGEGEKKIFVYLQDRAGNLSQPSELSAWVDITAPVVSALVLRGGAAVTGEALLPVALQASDLNAVVSMQVWEEGATIPAPVPFAESTSVQLRTLDYANTSRQVNAVVRDVAGNSSLMASRMIVFDDRGSLGGTLVVEDAANGSEGDGAGVTALVDGQSFALQLTATGQRGEFTFSVTGVAAGANRQLVLQKTDYADVAARAPMTVLPGLSTDVGTLRLQLARGSIEGYVQLVGELDHSGIVISIQGLALNGLTDATGHFRIDGVTSKPGYTLVLRRDDNWSVETVSGVDVPASAVVTVSTAGAPITLRRLGGTFSFTEGSYSSSTTVHLDLSYDGALEYRASEDGTFGGGSQAWLALGNAPCAPISGGAYQCPFLLGSAEGQHRVWVQFQDPSSTGFISEARSDVIVLDTLPPQNLNILINGGASYTSPLAVTLDVSGTDASPVATLELAYRDTTDAQDLHSGDWEARAFTGQPFGVVLPGAQAFRTARVWARLTDAAGNTSAPQLASIVVDPFAPVGGDLVINGDDALTRFFTVTLSLAASDDSPVEMLLGNEAVPATGSWQAFATSSTWVLPPATQGIKNVCVAFRDAAGNRTQDYCDAIEYDSVAPPVPAVTTTTGTYTRNPSLTLDLNNTSGVASIEVASNAAFAGARSYGVQAQVQYDLSGEDGTKFVFVRYIDAAGNASAPAVLTVILDREAPLAASLAFVDGAVTSSLRPSLILTALGASEMRISATADCSGGTWVPFSPQGAVDLAPPDALKDVSVQFRDQAGNDTACLHQQIELDRAPPSLGTPPMTLSGLQIVLNPGESAVEAAYVRIDFDVTACSEMKVWNTGGESTAVWQPYASIVPSWRLTPNDGSKVVYARFRDRAGNLAPSPDPASASITLDSTGDITGVLSLESSSDYSGVGFELGGTTFAHSMTGNRFTIANLLTKTYVPLRVRKPGYDDALLSSGVSVSGGGVIDVGTITLRRSRGAIEGYVKLADRSSHENVLIELLNTGYTTQSNSAGYFILEDVLAGSYDLVARRDGYSTITQSGIVVTSNTINQVSTALSPLTLAPQQGDFTINGGGSGFTSARVILLNLSYTGATRYRASEDASFGGGLQAYLDFTACTNSGGDQDCSFSLADADGPHRVYVQFEYGSPTTQESEVFDSAITLDRVAPTLGSVLIESGATATKELSASVAVSSSDLNGVVQMQRSVNGTSWLPAESFVTPFVWSYTDPTTGSPNPDDNLCIKVRFIDPAGNMSSATVAGAAGDCITLDRQVPLAGAPALDIQDAQGNSLSGGQTTLSSVFLEVAASGASEMMISNKQNFAGAVWQPYDDTQVQFWPLAPGDGLRTVYIAYKDQAGNIAGAGGTLNAAVTVDTVPPSAPAFTITQGAFTNTQTLNLSFSNWTSGESVLFESNRALGAVQTKAAAGSLSFVLPDVDGLHLLTLRYRDSAGNLSAASTASITLDRVRPDFLDLACLDCNIVGSTQYITSAFARVSVNASGATQMRITGNVLAPAPGTWIPYSPFVDVTLDVAAGEGNKAVTVALQDDATNASNPTTRSLTLYYDGTPPSCTLTLSGYKADGVTAAPAGRTAVTHVKVSHSGCTGSPTAMALVPSTQGLACASASYVPYAATTHLVVGSGDGSKNVLACYRDAAGNVTTTPLSAAASITLDQTAPSPPTLVGLPADVRTTFTVTWSSGDPSTVRYRFVLLRAGSTGVLDESTTATSRVLTAGTHLSSSSGTEYMIKVFPFDDLENGGAPATGSFLYDSIRPCNTSASLAVAGNMYRNADTASVTVACVGDVPDFMLIQCDGTITGSEPVVPYASTFTCALSSGDGLKTMDVRLLDRAGNVRDTSSAYVYKDTTVPSTPSVSPGNIAEANSSCARITVPVGSTLDTTFDHYEVRSNGGPWATGTRTSGGYIQFGLLQDTVNLLEVRAVDQAGNVSQPNVAYVNEVSSTLLPTGLELKQVCGNGAYAILRDTTLFPSVWAGPWAEGSTVHLSTPDIEVLNLSTLGMTRISGEGGLVASLGNMYNLLASPLRTWEKVADAGCAADDVRLLVSFVDTRTGTSSTDSTGYEYQVIVRNPIGTGINPTDPFDGPYGPWEHQAGTGLGASSIDVVDWTGTETYQALITYSVYILIPVTGVRMIQRTSTTNIVRDIYQSVIEFTPRTAYGLGFNGSTAMFLLRNSGSSRWELKRSTAYGSSGSLILSFPYSSGFSSSLSPWGYAVQQGFFNFYTTTLNNNVLVANSNGDVVTYRPSDGLTQTTTGGAPAYAPFAQRGNDAVAWVNQAQTNQFIWNNSYASTTVREFRYEIDRTRPILPTMKTGAGEPVVLYHTSGSSGGPAGVVVGFSDNSACAQ